MRKQLLGLVIAMCVSLALPAVSVDALGLKVAPLQYKAVIKDSEVQKGFIDISNPSSQTMDVAVSVQAFRQIDNDGGLEFYTDKQVGAAIKPELSTLNLGPRQAIRLFFTADGRLLPKGDVFAAIFFTTQPQQPRNGVGQLVRVGTLLSLVNASPGLRKAEITNLSMPFVQFDDTIHGSYGIKNTGPKQSGFFPTVTVSAWPGGKPKQIESSLVFGGRERNNDFTYVLGFGIHRLDVDFGDSQKSQWIVTIDPWMVVVLALVIVVAGVEFRLYKKRRTSRRQ